MTALFRESFDGYNALADMTLAGNPYNSWDTVNAGFGSFSFETPFGLGQSLLLSGSGFSGTATKGSFSNQPTMWMQGMVGWGQAITANTTAAHQWNALDGVSVQCTVAFCRDGAIRVYSGTTGGTLLATFTTAFLGSQWNNWRVEFVINNTTGAVHIRKNGNSVDDFVITNVNTRGGTGNNQMNGIEVQTNGGDTVYIKDVTLNDSTGADPNWNSWPLPVRSFQSFPNSDASVAWTQNNSASTQVGSSTAHTTIAVPANRITTTQTYTPTVGGTFTTMDANFNAGFTGNVKFAVYDMNGFAYNPTGLPVSNNQTGTLIAVSNTLVNPATGVNAVTFPSAVTLLNGHVYVFAMLSDTACVMVSVVAGGNVSGTNGGYWLLAQPFASGFPNPGTALTGSGFADQPMIYVPALTVLNSGLVNDRTEDGSTTYVSSSTPTQQDLYGTTGTPTPIAGALTIAGIDLTMMIAKSDAGARSASAQLKSGATTQTFTAAFPNTSFNFYKYAQDTDPNTGLPWAQAAMNAMELGLDLAS